MTLKRMVLLLLGLLILGGIGYLMAAYTPTRWHRVQAAFVRIGDAVISLSIALVGLWIVVAVLRAFHWWPTPN